MRTTVELGRELGRRVVAEGVETAEQCQALIGLGCTTAQGFYFYPPMPVPVAVEALRGPMAGCRRRSATAHAERSASNGRAKTAASRWRRRPSTVAHRVGPMANRLAGSASPYLEQHAEQPGRLVAVVGRRLRGGPPPRRPGPDLGRVRRLPLVPRHGARVVRGRGGRGRRQRVDRAGEGRPGGAAGRRRHLHDGHPGHDRPRRLADDGVRHPRRQAVLLRHLLPAHPVRPRAQGGVAGVDRAARGGREAGSGRRRGHRQRVRPGPADRAAHRRRAGRGGRLARGGVRPRRTAGSVARRSSRRTWRCCSCCGTTSAPARPRRWRSCATPASGWPAAACTTSLPAGSPATRSTRRGPCRTSRRCCTTTRCCCGCTPHLWRITGDPLALRVADETAAFIARDLGTDDGGFASALDADADGREGLTYVWTPAELRRGARRRGRRLRRRRLRSHRGRHVRARRERAATARRPGRSRPLARRPVPAVGRPRGPAAAAARRQGGRGLERPGDHGARRVPGGGPASRTAAGRRWPCSPRPTRWSSAT